VRISRQRASHDEAEGSRGGSKPARPREGSHILLYAATAPAPAPRDRASDRCGLCNAGDPREIWIDGSEAGGDATTDVRSGAPWARAYVPIWRVSGVPDLVLRL